VHQPSSDAQQAKLRKHATGLPNEEQKHPRVVTACQRQPPSETPVPHYSCPCAGASQLTCTQHYMHSTALLPPCKSCSAIPASGSPLNTFPASCFNTLNTKTTRQLRHPPAHCQAAQQLVAQRLCLGHSAKAAVGHLLCVQLHGLGREVEALLDGRCQLADAAALLTCSVVRLSSK
jgi:hypothetical protein